MKKGLLLKIINIYLLSRVLKNKNYIYLVGHTFYSDKLYNRLYYPKINSAYSEFE